MLAYKPDWRKCPPPYRRRALPTFSPEGRLAVRFRRHLLGERYTITKRRCAESDLTFAKRLPWKLPRSAFVGTNPKDEPIYFRFARHTTRIRPDLVADVHPCAGSINERLGLGVFESR